MRHAPATIALLLTLVLMAGCATQSPSGSASQASAAPTGQPDVDIAEHPIDDVLLNTGDYVGEHVSVSSDVEAIVGTHVFTLAAPEGPFVVVSADETTTVPLVAKGAAVTVTGVLRDHFDVAEVEQELEAELQNDLLTPFEGEPYVMADNITQASKDEEG